MARKHIEVESLHLVSCAPSQSKRRDCLPISVPFVAIRFASLRAGTPPREVPNEEPPSSPLEMPPDEPELPNPPLPEVPDILPEEPPQETPVEMPIEEGHGWPGSCP